MSVMNVTTPGSANTKKRELSSPEFIVDIKKNRVRSGSDSETDISDLSISEKSVMDTITETESTGTTAGSTEEVATLTFQEAHLEKIAALMKESFQPQLSQIVQDSVQMQVTPIVNSIVEGVLAGLTDRLRFLEAENRELTRKVARLEAAADEAEQYSRRNCLRVSGVPESPNEDTDELILSIATAIDVDLDLRDIYRSHRLGKPSTTESPRARPRDIIVKFATYRMRHKFYKARTLTKDRGHKGVFINEDLTKTRSKLLYEARRRVKSGQLKSAWSADGTILTRTSDREGHDRISRITSESDLPVYTPVRSND